MKGVHCAGCIQKIESRLAREPDVRNARLNFSTGRLNVSWEGDAARADDFAKDVTALGYGVFPYDVDQEARGAAAEERFLLLCLGVAGFAMGNIMLLSVGLWVTDGQVMGLATREFMHILSGLIAVPTVLFSGRPFFRSAIAALRNGSTNMDVPISLAITLAMGMSIWETLRHGEHAYFDSAVMLMFFLLIGRYLDARARRSARSTATDLLSTLSGFATVIEAGKTKTMPISEVREDMVVRVAVGEKFPVDGTIIEGESEVDTSLVTGETLPRAVHKGDDVFAGTMNLNAPVTVRVAKAAEDSLLSDIVRLMEKAGQGQAKYVRIADRAAQLYTPVVHTLALAAFLGWWLIGGKNWQDALMIAVTVLIITCPCALGLAVPVVQVLATGRLMKKGVLVKSGDALERLSSIDTILLDKTGTLTFGQPHLENLQDIKAGDFQMAASLAAQSTHPLSKALVKAFDGSSLPLEQVAEIPGCGMEAVYHGRKVQLGSRAWCGDVSASPPHGPELWLKRDGEAPVLFSFTDQLRPGAAEVITDFKQAGLHPVLLSGDREEVVETVAREVGIDDLHGQKTPPEKFSFMEQLKHDGHKVLMVGDGLNDAPVLAGADVSMSPSSAIDMAQNAADIVFMSEGLQSIDETYRVAVRSQRLVRMNFILAIAYNLIAVPLALAGWVTPMIAAAAMSGSSIMVIANSFRLRWSS